MLFILRFPVEHPEKTTRFFGAVFGWEFQKWGDEEYYLTAGGDPEQPGIGGAIMKRNSPDHPVSTSLSVESIDQIVPVIEEHGRYDRRAETACW